jgi:Fe-S oxidoreductase
VKRKPGISDISRQKEPLVKIGQNDLMDLPYPYNKTDKGRSAEWLADGAREKDRANLDGVSLIDIPEPESKEEEDRLVQLFLNGLKKLFSKEDNWSFLQPLTLSLENCAKCLACSDECPVYLASGRQEAYRPNYRSEVLRRIKKKYLDRSGKTLTRLTGTDIDLNWATIVRLIELAYRCTLCRRCAQACPLGIDNGLIAHEIRKLFSQEMGIAPKELHEMGTVQQLTAGTSTGTNPKAFKSIIQFMEGEIEEIMGRAVKIPVDKEGADILLIHNSGEFLSWLENPEAYAIIFEAAGVSWTLSSELMGYEATNYGVWYDDIQLARIALKHSEIARKLGVKEIVVAECGHAHKALMVVADRLFTEETNIPRESVLPLLDDIVCNEKIKLDPARNEFPVSLHDPCNIVRLMGIVEPQRRILRKICPQFREMTPQGVDNYCCGGGGGFDIMQSKEFTDWRMTIAGRMKFKQVLETFQDVISPEVKKYICTPCSNCKGQMRDLFTYYDAWAKCGLFYGGLAELIVNAMVDIKEPFITWEER